MGNMKQKHFHTIQANQQGLLLVRQRLNSQQPFARIVDYPFNDVANTANTVSELQPVVRVTHSVLSE